MDGTYGDWLTHHAGRETWARLVVLGLVASLVLAAVLTGIYAVLVSHRALIRIRPTTRKRWLSVMACVWLLAQAFLALVFVTQVLPEDGFESATHSP